MRDYAGQQLVYNRMTLLLFLFYNLAGFHSLSSSDILISIATGSTVG